MLLVIIPYFTTGNDNTAFGSLTLRNNISGTNNVANGYASLYANTTGGNNVASGDSSLIANTTGSNNTAIGEVALSNSTTSSNNTAMGALALRDVGFTQTAGSFNVGTSYTILTVGSTDFTLIGAATNTVGEVFITTGVGAGDGTATANGINNNTAIGANSGLGLITGNNNTLLGANITVADSNLSNNIIIADGDGNQRINVNNVGQVGIGDITPSYMLDVVGDINISSGASYRYNGVSVVKADTSINNYFFGNAGNLTMTGNANTATGSISLESNTTGIGNTANGFESLHWNSTGNYNTGIGVDSLFFNNSGYQNTAIGFSALYGNSAGFNNTASGFQTLYLNNTGSNNTAYGMHAFFELGSSLAATDIIAGVSYTITSTGTTDFTLIGAADSNPGTVFTASGPGLGDGRAYPNDVNNNTAIGYNTGLGLVSGGNNTILGANVTGLDPNLTGNIIIADGLGNQRINVGSTGNVGIGVSAPDNILHVTGTPAAGTHVAKIANTLNGATQNNGLLILAGNDGGLAVSEMITFQRPDTTVIGSISQDAASTVAYNLSSDRRIKDNITPTDYGLLDLLKINVDDFTFISDPSKKKMTGFIAQELHDIFPGAVTTNGDNGTDPLDLKSIPWMVDYSKLTPLIVKSVQDLNLNLEGLAGITAPVPDSPSESFVTAFFNNIKTTINAWLADVTNGIGNIFANVFNAKEKICVDGECLTKDDIHSLLEMAHPGGTGLVTTPPPTPDPAPVINPTPTPDPIPDPVPVVDPTSDPAPDPIVTPPTPLVDPTPPPITPTP
jgi:hypothetical protein